jgi:methylmalonyl-CoA mutase cobalamin-binding subunit
MNDQMDSMAKFQTAQAEQAWKNQANAVGVSGTQDRQMSIRERVQGACKRADAISGSLAGLLAAVAPPPVIMPSPDCISKERQRAATLSGDADDLYAALAKIERDLARLSSAILG